MENLLVGFKAPGFRSANRFWTPRECQSDTWTRVGRVYAGLLSLLSRLSEPSTSAKLRVAPPGVRKMLQSHDSLPSSAKREFASRWFEFRECGCYHPRRWAG